MPTITYEQASKPLPIWNPKATYFSFINLLMKTVGRLSEGVDLGYRYGFDSGVMLEYVYQNEARGKLGIGKAIDRLYLNAPSRRGIRNRGKLVTQTLEKAIRDKAANIVFFLRLGLLNLYGGKLHYTPTLRSIPLKRTPKT